MLEDFNVKESIAPVDAGTTGLGAVAKKDLLLLLHLKF